MHTQRMIRRIYASRHYYFAVFLLCMTCLGLLYIQYPLSKQLITLGDGTSSYLIPQWFFKQYASGQLPLWSPESGGGVPISSHMLGGFFPVPIFFAGLPLPWFVWLNYIFFVSFGACFFGGFLEELKVPRWLATLMCFVLLFSVNMGGARKTHSAIIESISLFPAVFYAFQRYINTQKRTAIVLAGIFMGNLLLIATPSVQYAMYLMLVMFLYVLMECIHKQVSGKKLAADAAVFLAVTAGIGAVQMIPGFVLMEQYAALSDASINPISFFTSFSIHPAKLLIMAFPNLFNDIYCSFGAYKSSGLDIELFLGAGAVSVIIFGLIRFHHDRRIWVPALLAGIVFLYAANANIPYLSRILYKIPILNTVRCPSRILFLFVFLNLTIFGLTSSRIAENYTELLNLRKFLCGYLAALMAAVAIGYFTPLYGRFQKSGEINPDWKAVAVRAAVPILVEILLITVTDMFLHGQKLLKRKAVALVLTLFTIGTIGETLPYAVVSNPVSMSSVLGQQNILKAVRQEIGNGKTISTYRTWDGGNISLTSYNNSQLETGIPSLNTYLTYNNPYLFQITGQYNQKGIVYYNYSGLQTGYTTIYRLLLKNDVLSMLGIKFIEDQTGILASGYPVVRSDVGDLIYKMDSITIPVSSGGYAVEAQNISLEKNTAYRVSFQLTAKEKPGLFYIDFYGKPKYDSTDQDMYFNVAKGTYFYSAVVNTGKDVPADTQIRIVSQNATKMQIKNLKVEKLSTSPNVYIPFRRDLSNQFYENTQAKNILYTVGNVKNIDNESRIAVCPEAYDFFNTSYVKGMSDMNVSNAQTAISDVVWLSNYKLQATVKSDQDTFINFSQCYDPSWKVFIDGKVVENHQVNLAIQGVFVRAGNHVITYEYQPLVVYISLVITLLTIFACILYFLLANRKDRIPKK